MRRAALGLLLGVAWTALGETEAWGQFTVGIDPPGYVPGGGPGIGYNGFGYGAYGPRGYGYYTGLPDMGYYGGGGPSAYFSPVFSSMAAAPRDRSYSSAYVPPGGRSNWPVSAPPPPRSGRAASEGRRGLLGRLFGR